MSSENRLGNLLEKIAVFSSQNPIKILILVLFLSVAAYFIGKTITIDPALESLIPKDRPISKEFVENEQDFKHTEYMISVVELPPRQPVILYRQFLRAYQAGLDQIPELDGGKMNINPKFVYEVTQYVTQHGLLLSNEEALRQFNELLSPENLQNKLNRAVDPYRPHLREKEFDPLEILPLAYRLIPLADRTTLDRSRQFFITEDPGTLFFLVGNELPWDWARTKKIVNQAAKIEKKAWAEFLPNALMENDNDPIPPPKISWIGKAMDIWRMTDVIWQSFSGSIISSSILVALVFLLIFPSIRALGIAYVPVFLALIWSIAFTRLTVGHLNMLSVIVWGMLIGLGIDFPTYLLNSYFLRRQAGIPMQEALRGSWRETGRPMSIGAFNVIIVFTVLLASRLPAFFDIGLISCVGLFTALILVLFTLPPLIRVTEGRRIPKAIVKYPYWLINIPIRYPKATMLACVLIFGGMSLFIFRFQFDSPFQEAYYMYRQPAELTSEIDRRFGELIGATAPPFRLVVSGKNWQEVLEKNESLANLLQKYQGTKEVAYFDSLYFFLASQKRQETILRLIPQLKNLNPDIFSQQYNEDIQALLNDKKVSRLNKQAYKIYGGKLANFLKAIAPTDPDVLKKAGLEKILNHYYKAKNGDILLSTYVYLPRGYYPKLKESLMDHLLQEEMFRKGMVNYISDEALIGEIRTILESDLYRLGALSLVLTTLMLFFAFRSIKFTLYASIPMVMGAGAAIGAYILLRGAFSVFNILWVPIYIGMASDDALHIGSHIVNENCSISDALRKAGGIVILTSITTMIGFGSMLFTDIEILKRISIWIVLALGAELLASLFFFPAMLQVGWSSGTKIAEENS